MLTGWGSTLHLKDIRLITIRIITKKTIIIIITIVNTGWWLW